MMTTKRRKMTDPTTWATDPTRMIPDLTRPGANGGGHDLIPTASIAASVLAQDATAGGASVATPTERPLIENGASNPLETSTNTKRHIAVTQCENCGDAFMLNGGEPVYNCRQVTQCENCGDAFMPRRPHGRFCSAYCRRQAWLGRNPEKAAELAERDRQRLREHVIGCGGEWVDRWHDGT